MFGIKAAQRNWEKLGELLKRDLAAIIDRLARLEKGVKELPTRAEWDAAVAALIQGIKDETAQVASDIQALRDQLANGVTITDQDLAKIQDATVQVGDIDPGVATP